MESQRVISNWLNKQHVLSYCVGQGETLWCANAFYVFNPEAMVFYLLSDQSTRHGEIIGMRAMTAGTVSGQTKNVALIRGVQFRGEILLSDDASTDAIREQYCRRFPVARVMRAPIWVLRADELKMTDNTLGFGKKFYWTRQSA